MDVRKNLKSNIYYLISIMFLENCTEEEKVKYFPLESDFEKRNLTSAIRIIEP